MNNLITCENGCRNPFATTEDFPNYWRLDGVGQWASRSSEYPIPASSGFTVVLSGTDVDSLLLVIFLQSSHHLPLDTRTPWLVSLIFSHDNYHLILSYIYYLPGPTYIGSCLFYPSLDLQATGTNDSSVAGMPFFLRPIRRRPRVMHIL